MKLVSTLLFYYCIITLSLAQNKSVKRDAFELTLPLDNGNMYIQKVPESNYFVSQTDLQIYPTEELFIEVELDGLNIKSLLPVKENYNPKRTLIVSFNQETKSGKSSIMILKIVNPFPFHLNYKTLIYKAKTQKWIHYKPATIKAKSTSYEMWNETVATIVIKYWNFTTKTPKM